MRLLKVAARTRESATRVRTAITGHPEGTTTERHQSLL
jgi:hypothetical protein